MKRIFTLLSMFSMLAFAAQAQLSRTNPNISKYKLPITEKIKTVEDKINLPKGSFLKQPASSPSYGLAIGYTWYDLQTNAGMQQRIYQDDAGNIQAIWTKALDTITDPANAFRGIGYNYYDASSQTWNPGDSLDQPYGLAEKRVGWPSLAPVAGNAEYIFAHTDRLYSNPAKGTSNYTPINLGGALHAATGVTFYHSTAQGNSIYVLNDNGASIDFGRSDDGGATWAYTETAPDSAAGYPLRPISADGADLDAKGDTVAVIMGGNASYTGVDPNDLVLYVSTDRGITWTHTVIHTFDTTNAVLDSASGGYVVQTPHADARVLIAADGSIHCVGSVTAVLTDQGALTAGSWYPLFRGIWYWNTNMAGGLDMNDPTDYDNFVLFDSVPDMTTMGTYPATGDEQASYVAGSFIHPNLTEDAAGNLFIVYDGITCGSNNNPFDNLYRRDLFGLASADGGTTWNDPKNIASLLFANDITDGTVGEEAYVNATKRTKDGNLHILFQYDSWAGTSLVDATVLEENFMTYLALDKTLLGIEGDKLVEESFQIYPNPTSGTATVSFDASKSGQATVLVTNLIGQKVKSVNVEVVNGKNNVMLDLNNLNEGIYLVTVGNGKNSITQKLVIE